MSDNAIRNCYPNPSLFECESQSVWADVFVGGILSIPILYFTVQVIRQYLVTKEEAMRGVAAFFIYTSFTFIAIIANTFQPSVSAYVTYSIYFYQSFPRILYCLSHCVLAEQTVLILVIVQIPFAKVLKYLLIICRYVFILISIFTAFFSYIPMSTEDTYIKVEFYSAYINPIGSYAYLVLHSIFILTTAIAFVFVPRISDLFDRKFIRSMRILLFSISLFFFIWYIFFTYQNQTVDFNRVIAIDSSIDVAIISLAAWNMVSEYIPRTLFATAMWYLSSTPKGKEENEEEQRTQVISQPLQDTNDDDYLFPN